MATVNEIQTGRFNSFLHKLLSMKEGAPAPTLSPEVVPVLPISPLPAEGLFLAGVERFEAQANVAAVVGQYSALQLNNPTASGVVCIIERLVLLNLGAAVTQLGTILTGALAVSNYGQRMDSRSSTSAAGVSTLSTASDLTAPGTQYALRVGETLLVPIDVVLFPGFAYRIQDRTVNEAVYAGFLWRQRAFEPSETR